MSEVRTTQVIRELLRRQGEARTTQVDRGIVFKDTATVRTTQVSRSLLYIQPAEQVRTSQVMRHILRLQVEEVSEEIFGFFL